MARSRPGSTETLRAFWPRGAAVCVLDMRGRCVQDPRWRALTEPAKDLILKLLQPDPKNRFTAKQALNHRWIKGAREDSILDGSVMEGWADHLQMLHPGYMGSPSPCAPPPAAHACHRAIARCRTSVPASPVQAVSCACVM